MKIGTLDEFGRFPYTDSLQYKLGIVGKPVVNYYFEIILDALDTFAKEQGIAFSRDPLLKKPLLMLSHDIDRLDAYSVFETGFKLKQLLGIAPSPYRFGGKLRDFFTSLFHFLNPFSSKNPFWSFEKMDQWERERGIKSTHFFLEREGGRNVNSRYRFHEKRIRNLVKELAEAGHEVGIHGTIQSATDQEFMDRTIGHLAEVSPNPVEGIRQHYLKFTPGLTGQIQEKAGLKYDASLGFAEHDGFRNSYCWPFKLFDHTENRILNLWEIPLTVMEGTHFYYRKLDFEEGFAAISSLASEVKRFNGVFSFLWHNHFFDEREYPGITEYYLSILDLLTSSGMEGIPGTRIIDLMHKKSNT